MILLLQLHTFSHIVSFCVCHFPHYILYYSTPLCLLKRLEKAASLILDWLLSGEHSSVCELEMPWLWVVKEARISKAAPTTLSAQPVFIGNSSHTHPNTPTHANSCLCNLASFVHPQRAAACCPFISDFDSDSRVVSAWRVLLFISAMTQCCKTEELAGVEHQYHWHRLI